MSTPSGILGAVSGQLLPIALQGARSGIVSMTVGPHGPQPWVVCFVGHNGQAEFVSVTGESGGEAIAAVARNVRRAQHGLVFDRSQAENHAALLHAGMTGQGQLSAVLGLPGPLISASITVDRVGIVGGEVLQTFRRAGNALTPLSNVGLGGHGRALTRVSDQYVVVVPGRIVSVPVSAMNAQPTVRLAVDGLVAADFTGDGRAAVIRADGSLGVTKRSAHQLLEAGDDEIHWLDHVTKSAGVVRWLQEARLLYVAERDAIRIYSADWEQPDDVKLVAEIMGPPGMHDAGGNIVAVVSDDHLSMFEVPGDRTVLRTFKRAPRVPVAALDHPSPTQQPATERTAPTAPAPVVVAAKSEVPPADPPDAIRTGAVWSDAAAEVDALGYEHYATALSGFLLAPATSGPLTVSIEGPWGAGKTTFLGLLARQLEAQAGARQGAGRVFVVRFNAWRFEKEEEIWAAFALKIMRDLSSAFPPRQRIRKQLALISERVRAREPWASLAKTVGRGAVIVLLTYLALWCVSAWIAGAGDGQAANALAFAGFDETGVFSAERLAASIVGPGVTAIALMGRHALQLFRNPIEEDILRFARGPDYRGRIGFVEDFRQDLRAFLDAHVGASTGPAAPRVVVLVDDLDRCEGPRAADLIRAINIMIPEDDSRMFFVLAMDRGKVAAGLAVKHREALPHLHRPAYVVEDDAQALGAAFGYAFLEKFIQLPIVLPVPTVEALQKLVEGEVGDSLGSSPTTNERRKPAGGASTGSVSADRGAPAAISRPPVAHAQPEVSPDAPPELRSQANSEHPPSGDSKGSGGSYAPTEQEIEVRALRAVIALAAPALDHNPRRVKLLVNQLRFRARLHRSMPAPLVNTLQLGKLIAIAISWPELALRLADGRESISRILADPKSRWRRDARLEPLLRGGGPSASLESEGVSAFLRHAAQAPLATEGSPKP